MQEDTVKQNEVVGGEVVDEESLAETIAKVGTSPSDETEVQKQERPKIQPLKRDDPEEIFYLDETVVIKGNTFKVRKITKKEVILRLEPTRKNQ